MELQNSWVEGQGGQWIFLSHDNQPMQELAEKVNINLIKYADESSPDNLGIRRYNEKIYSSNYIGVCRLKSVDGSNLLSNDGKEVVLKIEPRFPVSVVQMLDLVKSDDEFERYLAPQTVKMSSLDKEVEDLQSNELFHFFDKEQPIRIKDNIAKESSIITSTVFVSMLKDICRRPLLGRMISHEENLVGKVKGKILFGKNIKYNAVKGRNDRLYCKYLMYSEDVIENQVLKAALKKASKYINLYFKDTPSKENSYKDEIFYCQKALENISVYPIKMRDIDSIKVTGCYAYYKPTLSVAKMVLNEISLEANGGAKVTSYVVPYAVSMNKLFEMYTRAYLKNIGIISYKHPELDGIHIEKYDYKTQTLEDRESNKAGYINGPIKPDILIFDSKSGKKVVFDVKYKDYESSKGTRSDRLQLLAYALMYDCSCVGLIFPSQNDTSFYFDKSLINSSDKEDSPKHYHQIALAVTDHWTDTFKELNNVAEIDAIQYIRDLF